MASEKAKLKKAYIKGLIAKGDPRSYNEIQADLELLLWKERWESVFSAEPVMNSADIPIKQPVE
jgi:hypothetical protein